MQSDFDRWWVKWRYENPKVDVGHTIIAVKVWLDEALRKAEVRK